MAVQPKLTVKTEALSFGLTEKKTDKIYRKTYSKCDKDLEHNTGKDDRNRST